jgi:TniQ
MIGAQEDTDKPLPVVLKPVLDELLSSWLGRHATYYGGTGPFFANWLMLGTSNLSTLDHRLGLLQVARLSEKLRCDPIALVGMTFVDKLEQSSDIICRGRVPQICRPCVDRYTQENASEAISKHWRKAWRVTCPVCGSPLSDTIEHHDNRESLRDTSPFGRLWSEALAGEELIERFLGSDDSFEYSPITLMRLLLVQTWRPLSASYSYESAIGWVIGTVFPDFDVLARPIKRRITHNAISTLPICFRPALLAGLSRVMANPAMFQELRSATIFRGRKNFDRFYLEAKTGEAVQRRH